MKLLFDANLAPSLVQRLAGPYPSSAHVFNIGDISVDDRRIWNAAREGGFTIVSKDADFLELSLLFGHPPKVIFLRLGNCPTAAVEGILRTYASTIEQFCQDRDEALLVLGP